MTPIGADEEEIDSACAGEFAIKEEEFGQDYRMKRMENGDSAFAVKPGSQMAQMGADDEGIDCDCGGVS